MERGNDFANLAGGPPLQGGFLEHVGELHGALAVGLLGAPTNLLTVRVAPNSEPEPTFGMLYEVGHRIWVIPILIPLAIVRRQSPKPTSRWNA